MTQVSRNLHTAIAVPAISGNLLEAISQPKILTLGDFQQDWGTQTAKKLSPLQDSEEVKS